jgi:hypothetical protein
VKRTFRDLLPRPADLRKRLRQALTSGAIASVGLAPAAAANAASTADPVQPQELTIANRLEKGKKLILRLPNGIAYRMLQHKSHSSHSSHASHASHYSGSSGGTSTPAPRVTTPRAPTPSPVVTSPLAEQPPALAALAPKSFTGTIESVDKLARTVTIKQTDTSAKYVLGYRDDTRISTLDGLTSRLDDAMEKNNGEFPFAKTQKVRAFWKEGTSGKSIAITLARIN